MAVRSAPALSALQKADGLARDPRDAPGCSGQTSASTRFLARLNLLLNDPACGECVMPKSYLEPMILRHLQQSCPDVRQVVISAAGPQATTAAGLGLRRIGCWLLDWNPSIWRRRP